MNRLPIKTAANGYSKDPFYLIQTNGPEKRYVVSLRDKEKIKTIMTGFIEQMKNRVQIKIADLYVIDEPEEYYGELDKFRLFELMTEFEEVIFHHSHHDFMIHNPDSEDYIVFDEHGLLFIYTDEDYSHVLHQFKVEYRPKEKLIYEFSHWHVNLPNPEKRLNEMIEAFGLERS